VLQNSVVRYPGFGVTTIGVPLWLVVIGDETGIDPSGNDTTALVGVEVVIAGCTFVMLVFLLPMVVSLGLSYLLFFDRRRTKDSPKGVQ
jgi:hypothetical protein